MQEKSIIAPKLKPVVLTTQKKFHFAFLLLLLLVFIVFLATIAGFTFAFKVNKTVQTYNAAEKRLEVTKLPPDIKKTLETSSSIASASATIHIPILLYHYVEYVKDKRDTIRQSLDIVPIVFQKQLETLKDANYTFLTMKDIADIIDNKMSLPEKPIAITFDDGYRDLYTDVFPIIKKENVKITAFIVPGFLDQPNFLLTTQFQEIAQSGLVEISAHTMHHRYLKGASKAMATDEIVGSKVLLETMVHKPVVSFAYPYGAFDNQAIELIKNAGFKTAVSTIPGKEENEANRFFIYRIRPGGRTGDTLLRFLQQAQFKPW